MLKLCFYFALFPIFQVKSMLVNPVMRSASTSAASPHTLAGFQQQNQPRPLSSHSRGSEGAFLAFISA